MKLTDRIKKRAAELPPVVIDDTLKAKVVRDAFNFGAQVENLAAENERLQETVERMEREIDRLCAKGTYVTNERDYWRKLCMHWIEKAAQLTSMLDAQLALVQNAACTMQEAKLMADQILPPTNGVDTVSHVPAPIGAAPEPTLEDIQQSMVQ